MNYVVEKMSKSLCIKVLNRARDEITMILAISSARLSF